MKFSIGSMPGARLPAHESRPTGQPNDAYGQPSDPWGGQNPSGPGTSPTTPAGPGSSRIDLKRLVDADPPALVKLKRGIYAVPRTLSEVSERQNGNRSLTSTSDTSDGSDTPLDGKQATGRCARCGEPMVVFEPGQTVHPNCDPEGAAA